jgi:hypothetical protein
MMLSPVIPIPIPTPRGCGRSINGWEWALIVPIALVPLAMLFWFWWTD